MAVVLNIAFGFLRALGSAFIFYGANHQPKRFQCCRIVGELMAVPRGFTQLSIERLDRMSSVEHPSCWRRELQKRHEPLPRNTRKTGVNTQKPTRFGLERNSGCIHSDAPRAPTRSRVTQSPMPPRERPLQPCVRATTRQSKRPARTQQQPQSMFPTAWRLQWSRPSKAWRMFPRFQR